MENNLIFIYPGILLFAIAGIIAAIQSLKGSQDRQANDKKYKENAQNRLYEAGKELERVSDMLNKRQINEAFAIFDKTSATIYGFKHSDFSTIEWKNYFEQVQASMEKTKAYFSANYPKEIKKILFDRQAASTKALKAQRKKAFDQLTVLLLVSGAIFLIFFIARCQTN